MDAPHADEAYSDFVSANAPKAVKQPRKVHELTPERMVHNAKYTALMQVRRSAKKEMAAAGYIGGIASWLKLQAGLTTNHPDTEEGE